jgi:hypothetical protein
MINAVITEKNTIKNYMITAYTRKQLPSFTLFKSFARYCSLKNEFTVTQAVPPAARSMPHLKYLELAGNPITTLSNASFQGAMEHLQELDIRHLTLDYFEVKQLILPCGARVPRHSFPPNSPAHMHRHKHIQNDHSNSSSFALEIWLLSCILQGTPNQCHYCSQNIIISITSSHHLMMAIYG